MQNFAKIHRKMQKKPSVFVMVITLEKNDRGECGDHSSYPEFCALQDGNFEKNAPMIPSWTCKNATFTVLDVYLR